MLHACNVAVVDDDASSLQVDLIAYAVEVSSIFRKDVLESRLESSVVGAAGASKVRVVVHRCSGPEVLLHSFSPTQYLFLSRT